VIIQVAYGKALSIRKSECVYVALGIQHYKRIRLIILLSVACLTVPYFSNLQTIRFLGEKLLKPKYVFCVSLQYFSGIFLIVGRNHEDSIINVRRSSRSVADVLVCCTELEFTQKITLVSKLMEIHAVGAVHFVRTDRQTDVTKLIIAFRNFAIASRNCVLQRYLAMLWHSIRQATLNHSQ